MYFPPLTYPGTEIKRLPLKKNMISWSHQLNYHPEEFTHDTVLQNLDWADPEDPKTIAFGTSCEDDIDRSTCHPSKQVGIDKQSHRPLNPFGRTGISGRGMLGRWGVNHRVDIVITRWKHGESGILERDGKKLLEFLAIERPKDGVWVLPGGFVPQLNNIETAVAVQFLKVALENQGDLSEETKNIFETLFKDGLKIGPIYAEDYRNTDNAWIETLCINLHDETGREVSKLELKAGKETMRVRWMVIHNGLPLFSAHKTILRLIAAHHNAYF